MKTGHQAWPVRPGAILRMTLSLLTMTSGAADVCDRTPQVRDEIVRVTGASGCDAVTGQDLARVTRLGLAESGIETLRRSDFAGLTSLRFLELNRNGLTLLPSQAFAELSSLESLELFGNDLARLPDGLWSGLSSLQNLNLGGNGLTSLPARAFADLASLQGLLLHHNRLSDLQGGAFHGLAKLESLTLSDNDLDSAELRNAAFRGLVKLESLFLDGNRLAALPSGLAGLASLRTLHLSRNALTQLPPRAFAGLEGLQRLDLEYNQITRLQAGAFDGLSELRSLKLSSNGLSKLDEGAFAGLPRLESLELQRNTLAALPADVFAGLSSLRRLDLSNNAFNTAPVAALAGLSGLQALHLERNPGSPFTLSARRQNSWCSVQETPHLSFQRPSGKTLSICEKDGTLTYSFGHLDAAPELRYSGRTLVRLGGPASVATEVPNGDLGAWASWTDDPDESRLLRELACARRTNGFVEMSGYTGYLSTSLYVFRAGGWQYEIAGEWGRTLNAEEGTDEYEELANHEQYFITTRSPDDQTHCPD